MEKFYLSVLLHEMTHSFLEIYSCRRKVCRSKIHPSIGGYGEGGHGPVWANSIRAIEEVFKKQVSWQVELGLRVSILHEIKTSNWEPEPDEFVRWGMEDEIRRGTMPAGQPQRGAQEDFDTNQKYHTTTPR
jgi:hypothetical protein